MQTNGADEWRKPESALQDRKRFVARVCQDGSAWQVCELEL